MKSIRTELIEAYLLEKELSHTKFAMECGIHLRMLERILENDLSVDAYMLARVAIKMGTSVDELLGLC